MEKEKLELEVTDVKKEENASKSKPTDEEIKQFEKEFAEAAEKFNTSVWTIGDETNGEKLLDFTIEFLEKYGYWSKNLWMGVCRLSEELNEIKSKINETKLFSLTYHALEFTFYLLSNPAGIGLQSAKEIEQKAQDLTDLFGLVNTKLEEARQMLKDIQYLQDKVSSAYQGFYLADLEPKLEEADLKNCNGECNCDCKNEACNC